MKRGLKGPIGTSFQPGVSGNPGGRPRGYQEMREMCRARTKEAIEALTEALKDPDPKVRINAACALLDRGWGRPAQSVDVTAEGKPSVSFRIDLGE